MGIDPSEINRNFLSNLPLSNEKILIDRTGQLRLAATRIEKIRARIFPGRHQVEEAICAAGKDLVKKAITDAHGDLRLAEIITSQALEKLRRHGYSGEAFQSHFIQSAAEGVESYIDSLPKPPLETRVQQGITKKLATRASRATTINNMNLDLRGAENAPHRLEEPSGRFAPTDRYYIYDESGKFATFKPKDKELGSESHPEHYQSDPGHEGYVRGVRLGTEYLRSTATYEFAKEKFACVPPTTIITLTTPRSKEDPALVERTGALQQEIPELKDTIEHSIEKAEEGALEFDDFFDRESAQEMTLMDLLIGNTNRSQAEFMVDPATKKVHALENGRTFPESLMRFENPSSNIVSHFGIQPSEAPPVPIAATLKEKILAIDPEREAQELLDKELINDAQAKEFILRTRVVQHLLRIEPPLDLRKISAVFMPEDPASEPLITTLCKTASESKRAEIAAAATPEEKLSIYFRETLSQIPRILTPE